MGVKMHRVVLYVKDIHDESNRVSLKRDFENGHCPEFVHVDEIDTVDIGEWHDGHPLNKIGADHKGYFK